MTKHKPATAPVVLRYGCHAHQDFEIRARHVHQVGRGHAVFGDGGARIMRVVAPQRKCPKGIVHIYNTPYTIDGMGTFSYKDHFLKSELGEEQRPCATKANPSDIPLLHLPYLPALVR